MLRLRQGLVQNTKPQAQQRGCTREEGNCSMHVPCRERCCSSRKGPSARATPPGCHTRMLEHWPRSCDQPLLRASCAGRWYPTFAAAQPTDQLRLVHNAHKLLGRLLHQLQHRQASSHLARRVCDCLVASFLTAVVQQPQVCRCMQPAAQAAKMLNALESSHAASVQQLHGHLLPFGSTGPAGIIA